MQCSVCNHLGAATDVRCIQCGNTLIHEAVGHSEGYRKATDYMDGRLYGGIGAFFGFVIVATLLKFVFVSPWLNDREIYAIAMGGGVAGLVAGRLLLRAKRRGY